MSVRLIATLRSGPMTCNHLITLLLDWHYAFVGAMHSNGCVIILWAILDLVLNGHGVTGWLTSAWQWTFSWLLLICLSLIVDLVALTACMKRCIYSLLDMGAFKLLLKLRRGNFRLHSKLAQVASTFGSWFAQVGIGLWYTVAAHLVIVVSSTSVYLLEILQTKRIRIGAMCIGLVGILRSTSMVIAIVMGWLHSTMMNLLTHNTILIV